MYTGVIRDPGCSLVNTVLLHWSCQSKGQSLRQLEENAWQRLKTHTGKQREVRQVFPVVNRNSQNCSNDAGSLKRLRGEMGEGGPNVTATTLRSVPVNYQRWNDDFKKNVLWLQDGFLPVCMKQASPGHTAEGVNPWLMNSSSAGSFPCCIPGQHHLCVCVCGRDWGRRGQAPLSRSPPDRHNSATQFHALWAVHTTAFPSPRPTDPPNTNTHSTIKTEGKTESKINPSTSTWNWKKYEWTYHFVIDFMKMNFTDFLYDVFTLKSYETKSYAEKNREGRGKERKTVSFDKTSKRKTTDGLLSRARFRNYASSSL